MARVVPWAEAVPGVAALGGLPESAVRAQIAHFPAAIEGWAAVTEAGVVASGILVERDADGPALVRLRGPGADALVDWLEARATGRVKVSIADAPGVAERLAATGYRWIEAHLTLRNTAPFPAPAPLPPGFTVAPLASISTAAWIAFHNTVFAGVPGSVDLTEADWARIVGGDTGDVVQLLRRGDQLAGFWHVAHDPEDGPTLERLGVHADARGLGLGRTLLRQAQRALGTPTCALRTSVTNTAAVGLYRAEGYVEVDRRDEWARGSR